MEDSAPKTDDRTTITDSLLVNRYAVEAGVISNETTRIMPTVCKKIPPL